MSAPSSPGLARRGAWLTADLKRVLPPAAIAAAQQAHPLAFLGQVGNQGLAVLFQDLGADGHLEHDVLAHGAGAVAAHAVGADLGLEVLAETIVDQGVEAVDRLDKHMTATPAVTAVGSAVLDEFFTPERHAACAAIAGLDVDFCLVEKFHAVSALCSR